MGSYGEWQPIYRTLPIHVELREGLSNIPEYSKEPTLLVIDDQMDEVDKDVMRLFTKVVITEISQLFTSCKISSGKTKTIELLALTHTTWSYSKTLETTHRLCI